MNLVLLPGFMTDTDLWSDIVARLAEVGPIAHGDLARGAAVEGCRRRIRDAPFKQHRVVRRRRIGLCRREVRRGHLVRGIEICVELPESG